MSALTDTLQKAIESTNILPLIEAQAIEMVNTPKNAVILRKEIKGIVGKTVASFGLDYEDAVITRITSEAIKMAQKAERQRLTVIYKKGMENFIITNNLHTLVQDLVCDYMNMFHEMDELYDAIDESGDDTEKGWLKCCDQQDILGKNISTIIENRLTEIAPDYVQFLTPQLEKFFGYNNVTPANVLKNVVAEINDVCYNIGLEQKTIKELKSI